MSKNVLIVPGSLRPESSTHKLIHHIVSLLPAGFNHTVTKLTGELPHFDDPAQTPESVLRWRQMTEAADGIMIVTPEYAFGVPGTLKNALDWLVGSGSLLEKKTALITASTGGQYAHQSLLLTLEALNAKPPEDCQLLISFIRSKMNSEGNIHEISTGRSIVLLLEAFVASMSKDL